MTRAEELVRAIYERWAAGDFTATLGVYDDHTVFIMGDDFPDPGTYVGREGIARYMHNFLEAWERVTIAPEEMVVAGDSVFVAIVMRGAGSGSGAETELRYFQVWTFRGETLVRLENFRERADALAAVGLSD